MLQLLAQASGLLPAQLGQIRISDGVLDIAVDAFGNYLAVAGDINRHVVSSFRILCTGISPVNILVLIK